MKPIFYTAIAFAIAVTSSLVLSQEKKEKPAEAKKVETVDVGSLKFKFSKPWSKEEPKSSMRAAQLKYDNEGELADIDAVFFKFGPQSVDANLARWKGQFQGESESKTEKKKYGDTEVTYFTASGTFLDDGGRPFAGTKTPRENWVMMAAIIPLSDSVIFIKLVGPADAMGALEDDYKALVASPFAGK